MSTQTDERSYLLGPWLPLLDSLRNTLDEIDGNLRDQLQTHKEGMIRLNDELGGLFEKLQEDVSTLSDAQFIGWPVAAKVRLWLETETRPEHIAMLKNLLDQLETPR